MEKEDVERLVAVEERAKSNTKRIDEHDSKMKELSNVYIALTKVDNKVTNVENDVSEMKSDLKEIKEKPAKRWESIIVTIITRYSNSSTGIFYCKNRNVRKCKEMKEWKKLIDVKSIITIALTILFIVQAYRQIIDGNAVITIYTTVIAFYFGTQYQKNEDEEEK